MMKRGLVICLLILFVGIVSAGDVNFILPSQGGEYNDIITSIDWSYSSNLTINSTCEYNLNDGNDDQSFDCLTENSITGISSEEGYNNWTLSIRETPTSSIDRDFITFFVDSEVPIINVLSPTNETYYTNQNFISVNLTVTKEGTILGDDNLTSFEYTIYKSGVQDFWGNLLDKASYLFRYPSAGTANDGNYSYKVELIENIIGHPTIYHYNFIEKYFIFDTQNPSISITTPSPNSNHSNGVSITLNASDSLSGIESTLINISNGTYSDTSTNLSYSWDSSQVSDGAYNITAIATDKAGNSDSTTIIINVDNSKPKIYFNSPDADIYNSNQTINITASDAHLKNITLFVDGSIRNFTTTSELISELGEGNHTVYATACDTFNNCNSTESRIIEVDTIPPYLTNATSLSYLVFSPANSDGFFDSVDIIMNASELIKDWNTTYIYNSSNEPVFRENSPDGSPDNLTSFLFNWDGKYKYYSPAGNYVPDGIYTINTTITDRAGNSVEIYVGNVTIDNTAPTINLTGNSTITLEVFSSYTEQGATTDDGSPVVIDNSIVNTSLVGSYNITYNSEDDVKNSAIEVIRTVNVVDTTVPVITLIGNSTITIELGSNYTEQGATATDTYDGNLIGSLVIDNSSLNTNAVGTYNITYNVNDSSDNFATEVIRTVNVVDTTLPIITPISPNNNQAFAFDDNDVSIEYSYSDSSPLDNCSLILNSVPNQFGTSNFTLNDLSSGEYAWQIICNDSETNQGTSSIRQFTILSNFTEASEFSEYTNLAEELNISNVLYFFVNGTYGMINFTEQIDFSSGFDWTLFISISGNRIYVNSTGQSELNKAAIITFYNVTLSDPEVLKDGSSFCHSTSCPSYSYANNILTITVTEFSEYTLREYVAPSSSSSSSSSGGGGGSTAYWTCIEWEEWSECADSEQTRFCEVKERATYTTKSDVIETRTCTETTLLSSNEEVSTTPQEEIIEEEPASGLFGITGAAITDLAGTGKGKLTIAFIVLVLIGGIGFTVYRRKFKKY
ncbi:DUF5011 domain-containing protein [Candidatus Pacearchaeota archaeon]|nr:DUF5011 domain-containing protein [Candidatus Pacearchaeota archaeon]